MTETVVRVSTIEEWKAVLDVWFKQGYEWLKSKQYHREDYFNKGSVLLGLNVQGKDEITYFSENNYSGDNLIEYVQFMSQQQKEGNNMETYYVTQEQLDFIEELKDRVFPLSVIFTESNRYKKINVNNTSSQYEKALLRYLGGDETIEFKCKEQLYRLSRIDDDGDTVYMHFVYGSPDWTMSKGGAFTAPLEEITKWKTPAWAVEEAR